MSVEEQGRSSQPAPSLLSRVSTSGRGSHEEPLNSSPASPHCFFSSPEADLVREISAVELEICHLEQHLLSLYRALFNGYLRNGGGGAAHERRHSGSLPLASPPPSSPWISSVAGASPPPEGQESQSSLLGSSKPISPHRRLAPPAITSWPSESPCKLSEDIIKCISSVYAELAVSPSPRTDSPPSSSSSTSTLPHLHDRVDSWSSEPFWLTPRRSLSKEVKQEGPYGRMLQVSKISADGSRFASAASILQNYRVLISRLETTDPGELTRDEKLAFWVNVHNALVMHAFLAYGLRNHSSTRTSFSKAAYNVGGLTVNAREIRASILGCQSDRPEPMRTLFPSRSQKSTRVRAKHSYAVDQPEPLVHFALCGGAYSDPAVRVYSAMNVRRELEAARDEFLQSNVLVVREKKKVLLPKLLVNYAADAGVDPPALLEMVWAAVPEKCRKGGVETCSVDYFPYKSNFRYVIHGDLVQRVE